MHLVEASSVGAMLLCLRAQVVKPFAPGQVLPSMWTALLNQTSGLQGCCDVSCGILAGSDPGTGSGWQQSRPNRTPLCSDEIVSPNATAAPLSSSRGVSLHRFLPPVPGKACCTSPPTSTLRRQKASAWERRFSMHESPADPDGRECGSWALWDRIRCDEIGPIGQRLGHGGWEALCA